LKKARLEELAGHLRHQLRQMDGEIAVADLDLSDLVILAWTRFMPPRNVKSGFILRDDAVTTGRRIRQRTIEKWGCREVSQLLVLEGWGYMSGRRSARPSGQGGAMHIRDAVPGDALGIMEIYNDAVASTTAIWNETTVDAANRAAWIAARQGQGYPVLVATVDQGETGRVLGYASFGPWRPFDGYRHTVEHSVYVRRDARGSGLGTALLAALVERARAQGMHVMVAGIEAGNAVSIAMHRKLGFVQTGLMPEVGTKFGRWLDLAFLQLTLDDRIPE
jgi:phosphinothricin acetyltransferase